MYAGKNHNGHNHDTVKKMAGKHRQELTAPVEMILSLSGNISLATFIQIRHALSTYFVLLAFKTVHFNKSQPTLIQKLWVLAQDASIPATCNNQL